MKSATCAHMGSEVKTKAITSNVVLLYCTRKLTRSYRASCRGKPRGQEFGVFGESS